MGWLEGGVGKNVTQRRGDAIDIGRAGKGQGGAAAKEAKADHRETKPDMHGSVLGGHGSAHTPGKESDEGRWFTAPAATDLTGENDELALGGLPQFKGGDTRYSVSYDLHATLTLLGDIYIEASTESSAGKAGATDASRITPGWEYPCLAWRSAAAVVH
ncbi:hypothetical protein AK812_SmicGene19101 [Symbiodinium microadriaticum]|uniref:Uncharacterized protein n=1 Tax=Symbiodinium microadriaticum TaxID=2951 RepID=A0A1Q9DTF8_SYMMI|nr:hypothetical protein AK812_SmicGene19101 [Symbiodinium microadriaticum]CAE7196790.1 unnamed protein product [Symbiodinium sp. KB8]